MTPDAMKPCPFCGKQPRIMKGLVAFRDIEIVCDCGASGGNHDDHGHDNETVAIVAWNTRAAPAQDAETAENYTPAVDVDKNCTPQDHVADLGNMIADAAGACVTHTPLEDAAGVDEARNDDAEHMYRWRRIWAVQGYLKNNGLSDNPNDGIVIVGVEDDDAGEHPATARLAELTAENGRLREEIEQIRREHAAHVKRIIDMPTWKERQAVELNRDLVEALEKTRKRLDPSYRSDLLLLQETDALLSRARGV